MIDAVRPNDDGDQLDPLELVASPLHMTPQMEAYVAEFSRTGCKHKAAAAAGIAYGTAWSWLKTDAGRSAHRLAKIAFREAMIAEMVRRGVHGWDEPVHYQGVECGVVRKFDSKLLIKLVEAEMPEKYGPKQKHEHTGRVDSEVRVVFEGGWYGNNAHDRLAQAAAPPA